MYLDIIKAYADAVHVATTLRPPVSPSTHRETERRANGEAPIGVEPSVPLVGRMTRWVQTRLGQEATGEPAASLRSLRSLPKI